MDPGSFTLHVLANLAALGLGYGLWRLKHPRGRQHGA